jgi:hypothetical protein
MGKVSDKGLIKLSGSHLSGGYSPNILLEASEIFPTEIQNHVKTSTETRRVRYKSIKKIPGLDILSDCYPTLLCQSDPAFGGTIQFTP